MFEWLKRLFCSSEKTEMLHPNASKVEDALKRRKSKKSPRPRKTLPINTSSKITYLLNDPETPELVELLDVPIQQPKPYYTVTGWQGGGAKPESLEAQAAQAYCALMFGLEMSKKAIGKEMDNWAVVNNLLIIPRAGTDLNAYYDRRHLKFFFARVSMDNVVYTVESVDIVAHELGHAVLDYLRPDFWASQAAEVWAFHEAFGDISAMLTILQRDKIIDHVIKITGGNLKQHNLVTRLAEEMGVAIYKLSPKSGRSSYALRNAVNDFVYELPANLPMDAPGDKLSSECHSFGRLFVATWYDIMTNMYEIEVSGGMSKPDALRKARDEAAKMIFHASARTPHNSRLYESLGKTMLFVSREAGGKYQEAINRPLIDRKIVSPKIRILADKNLEDIKMKKGDVGWQGKNGTIINKGSVKTLAMSDYLEAFAQEKNPLYSVKIDVPMQNYMEFDRKGKLVDEVTVFQEDTINDAKSCLQYLHKNNMVGDQKMFDIVNGKLVRNKIECC